MKLFLKKKSVKQWNRIQNFIKIDIYSPKSPTLKSVENYIKSEWAVHKVMLYTIMNTVLFTMT